ncbi:glycoside hydrolase N-terminal domain-containing protein [uncultured Muribaculum sp.]|uniref:glycoside hydrolase N-terminal domain-containing protein n=1 Tax=uncultured Muribaculum sp. TaxID=1918613 RepID=UPI0026DF56C3|nr:glycoside hydrolase N-terminal domain-containing protein [uncultured Muribaculum sp.]
MLKKLIFICAALAGAAVSLSAAAAKADSLTFDKPAREAAEAVKIGGALTAATIYGTYPDEHIEINDGETNLSTLTIYHSVPLGSRITGYRRGLDSSTDVAFTDIDLTNGRINEKYFASPADSVLVMTYSDELPLFCTIVLKSDYAGEIKSFDDRITMKGTLPGGSDFTTILKVIPGAGNITTNPDASLTLNYMKGATLVISTVKSAEPDLARLRVFRASLRLSDGLDAYRLIANDAPLEEEQVTYTSVAAPAVAGQPEATDIMATDAEGHTDVVLRTTTDRIDFLPFSATRSADGEAADVEALAAFKISFRWEKGNVTGGNISYYPKDYMAQETDVDLILNGELHRVHFTAGQTIPLENFVDLVRPFIQ